MFVEVAFQEFIIEILVILQDLHQLGLESLTVAIPADGEHRAEGHVQKLATGGLLKTSVLQVSVRGVFQLLHTF